MACEEETGKPGRYYIIHIDKEGSRSVVKRLVKCADCEYHHNAIMCRCGGYAPGYWFCADGKRRGDNA